MSKLVGNVGAHEIEFLSVPHGSSGVVQVRVGGKGRPGFEVRWRKDADGIWIETPDAVTGFDIQGERDDDGVIRYQLAERGGEALHAGLAFLRGGEAALAAAGPAKKGARVKAQMPGKIIRLLVKQGDQVVKDQPLLVMEAMKMENE